eukprot:4910741-Prymnesium_polylepis.1
MRLGHGHGRHDRQLRRPNTSFCMIVRIFAHDAADLWTCPTRVGDAWPLTGGRAGRCPRPPRRSPRRPASAAAPRGTQRGRGCPRPCTPLQSAACSATGRRAGRPSPRRSCRRAVRA